MLVTRCPHCQTSFRIRPEHLNQRGGRVRCGHCQTPFSALQALSELPDETGTLRNNQTANAEADQNHEPAISEARTTPSTPDAHLDAPLMAPIEVGEPAHDDDFEISLEDEDDDLGQAPLSSFTTRGGKERPAQITRPSTAPAAKPAVEPAAANPPHLTLPKVPLTQANEAPTATADTDIHHISEPHSKGEETAVPQLHTMLFDADEEIAKQLAEEAKLTSKKRRRQAAGLIFANFCLGLSALCLATFLLRTHLAGRYPQLRQPMEQACAKLRCNVPYLQDKDAFLLEGIELTPDTPAQDGQGRNHYQIAFTLRNEARHPVAWPQLDITLTDRYERTLTRRIIDPRDWLPVEQRQEPAFSARGELTAHLRLKTEVEAMGYRLGVFYR